MLDDPTYRERLLDHLTLALTPGVGPVRLRVLLDRFGSPNNVLRAPVSALLSIPGLGPKTARGITASGAERQAAARMEIDVMKSIDAHAVMFDDDDYPSLLRDLPDAPSLLFVRGTLDACQPKTDAGELPVAIVGSRKCTAYGERQTRVFAASLVMGSCSIVSGGARGIDAAAHRTALTGGGSTIAVLGCGLAQCYPPEHAGLFEDIVASGRGAVVSELPMNTPPNAENFPARNRIISGLSLAVLVVEASRRSGALITARLAVEEHGRDALALPGRIGDEASAGALTLVKSGGAALATEPADVLDAVRRIAPLHGWTSVRHDTATPTRPSNEASTAPFTKASKCSDNTTKQGGQEVSGESKKPEALPLHPLITLIGDGCTFESLVDRSGTSPAQLQAEITMLEITGDVRREGIYLKYAR